MSSDTSYSPTTDREFWVELEIPYGLHDSNWDEHGSRLERHVEQGRILKRHFTPHWELNKDKDIPKKVDAIETLTSEHPEWANAILCAYEFSRNTNKDQVIDRLRKIDIEDDDPLSSHVDTALSNSDKKFAVILLDLIQSKRLRDIYVLSRLRRRSPISTFEISDSADLLEEFEDSKLLEELEDQTREFNIWHQFRSNGNVYLVLKIHEEDDVQIQPETNAEVEEGNLLILKAKDDIAQIYARSDDLLGAAQRGIQKGIESGDNDIDDCTVEPANPTMPKKDYDEAVQKIESGDTGSSLSLHKLHIENAPLSGSPKLRLSNPYGDLTDAIEELKANDIPLLEDPDSIEQIGFMYDGRKFTLYPEEKGETVRLRYQSSINDEGLLDGFESEVENLFDISLIFERE